VTSAAGGPSSSAAGEYGGWLFVGLVASAGGLSAIVSVAGATASALGGHGWAWEWRPLLFADAFTHGPRSVWPGASVAVFAVATGLGLTVIAALGVLVAGQAMRRISSRRDPAHSLARPADVRLLRQRAAVESARRLRADLGGTVTDADLGPRLGVLAPRGPELRSSWEDVHLLVMAPRAGKTTAFAVPVVLDAPGPVLATSNKSDLLTDTAGIRRDTGQVWVFDPQGIALSDRLMSWNPLDAVHDVDTARRLAAHFMQEIATQARASDFWSSAALGLLSSLILAAGIADLTLLDVWRWLNDSADPEPGDILESAGLRAPAAGLRGRQGGAIETREGIYETARTAAQCLESDAIVAWAIPSDRSIFDPAAFVSSKDALYLMSKEDRGSAQPLVAALADQVIQAAVRAAERSGGRLDPPLTCVLDEAANVCKIRDLPALYSHLGSRGVSAWTILQSYRQGRGVWGDNGMDTLWSAATIKIVGSGLDDASLAEDLSKLAGEHDVATRTFIRGDGRPSTSTSTKRQRIIPPDQIRALPRGRALLLATATPVAMLQTTPWYRRRDADSIRRAAEVERVALTDRARG
jgi:type IV secretory pathway TraG/TraD family ATPase VirD4